MGGIKGGGAIGPDLVVGIDQYDVVVHHYARESDDAHAHHDDAERLAVDQQSQQYSSGRKNDSRHDQHGLIPAIELHQQDQQHKKDRNHKSHSQEAGGLLLIGALARGIDPHTHRQIQTTVEQRAEPRQPDRT